MEEEYDYSRHKYCITLDFGYNITISDIAIFNKLDIGDRKFVDGWQRTASLLYDTTTGTIMAKGNSVDRALKSLDGLQKGVIYIPNVFIELKKIDFKDGQKSYHPMAVQYEKLLQQEAINLLQEIRLGWKQEKEGSDVDFYYAIITPTNWEYETRNEFFRPLLIKAGLIHENDSQGRLIFYSKIEPIFHHIQKSYLFWDTLEMKPGNQYIICTEDYQDKFCVNLELVSAQYPDFTVKQSSLVPQLVKQIQFTIPLDAWELRSSLVAYLERICGTTLPPEIIDPMFTEVSRLSEDQMYEEEPSCFFYWMPFKGLPIFSDNQCSLKEKEINALQSINKWDIYENVFGFSDKIFNDQMDVLLKGMNNIKTRFMIIFDTNPSKRFTYSTILLKLIERWSEAYREQKKLYVLNVKDEAFNYYKLHTSGTLGLIYYHMQVFNMRRAPVILPMDTAIEHSKRCTTPVIFVNIDMSPTQTKTTVTYLNENGQVKQTKTFDCSNIKPLDSFITYSKLCQKPILHIQNRLKLLLKNIFGDYLKVFSTSNKQSMTRRILKNQVSKLLNRVSREPEKSSFSNFNRMKSSKNPLKEIRNLFASSNPNLFKQLTEDIKMKDLFTSSNGTFCDSDNNSFTTCHPGYIFFFTITYLYSLNKLLEENLENEVGSNWRSNNIWYGVSIDKNLLDTVFGSVKTLEKSFFACGILQKEDNRRRAKFCTRGEEILPAIQRKLVDLEFRIKSYFVVAQVFSKHIQLTLHQVVILASSEEDAASIIIQDEIIYIDDVYDNLCKTLWSFIQAHCQVNSCATHKGMHSVQYDLCAFQAYSDVTPNLKRSVVELLEMNKTSMDMNSKTQLNINSECACNISIFLCVIMEVALMSVIENIATIIVASLTNKELFRDYAANYIFVSGDPFNLSYGSKIHTSYTMLLQKAIDDAVKYKEKDTMTFVLGESLYQLLQLVTQAQPYMFEHFITGKLCQVSSETYALRIKQTEKRQYLPFTRININGDIKNTLEGDGSYLVFIQRGKPVSTKSFTIINQLGVTYSSFDVIKSDSSRSAVPNKYSVLDTNAAGTKYGMETYFRIGHSKIVVQCKHVKHYLSFQVSVGSMGVYPDNADFSYYHSIYIIEPLTLAYI